MRTATRTPAAVIASILVLIVAGVHFQQYGDFISHVPTIGVLFLLNASGGAALAIALLSGEPAVRRLAALGALGLVAGSLVSIAIALNGQLFGYSEPTLRTPILIAIIAEGLAIPALLAVLLQSSTPTAGRSPRRGAGVAS